MTEQDVVQIVYWGLHVGYIGVCSMIGWSIANARYYHGEVCIQRKLQKNHEATLSLLASYKHKE